MDNNTSKCKRKIKVELSMQNSQTHLFLSGHVSLTFGVNVHVCLRCMAPHVPIRRSWSLIRVSIKTEEGRMERGCGGN